MTNFRVGQKVVCIWEGDWIRAENGEMSPRPWPEKDAVYRITAIGPGISHPFMPPHAGLFLAEMRTGRSYCSLCFRPVTDIAVFEALLITNPVEELV